MADNVCDGRTLQVQSTVDRQSLTVDRIRGIHAAVCTARWSKQRREDPSAPADTWYLRNGEKTTALFSTFYLLPPAYSKFTLHLFLKFSLLLFDQSRSTDPNNYNFLSISALKLRDRRRPIGIDLTSFFLSIQSNPMSSDGRRNSSMPASQIHTQIQIGRSPVPVRLALKS